MTKRRLLFLAISLTLVVLIAVACQPETETVEVTRVVTETVVEEGEEVEVTRIVSEEVEVTRVVEVEVAVPVAAEAELDEFNLIVWFLSQSPDEIELNRGLIEDWAANYDKADVTIDFSPFAFEDWNTAMKLALDGRSGPDVAYGSPGPTTLGAWGEVGHLLDMTDIAEERGWMDKIPPDVTWYYNKKGPGHLYSMQYDSVGVGVYYNKAIFEEMGYEIPETLEDFEALMATMKDDGLVPMSTGGQTPWQLAHIWSTLSTTNTPWESYEAWIACEGGVVPEMVEAAERFNTWVDAEYFNDNALATAYADSSNLFLTGEVAMNIGGTWNNSQFGNQTDVDVGFFAMPRMNPDLPEYHMAGFTPNNGWAVPVYGEHQEAALDLMDFMIASEESATARWNDGNIVAYNFETLPDPVYPLQADVYNALSAAMPGTYEGNVAGEVGPAIGSNFQAMYGGEMTPEEAMVAIDEVYQAACAAKLENQ